MKYNGESEGLESFAASVCISQRTKTGMRSANCVLSSSGLIPVERSCTS